MRQLLQLVFGLLACLALASALPGLFPRDEITTYRYYADLKTGNIEPTPYASQFVYTGLMYVTPETRVPNSKNAFSIRLNVTHAIRNGEIQHFERIEENTLPIPDAARVLNDPFIIIFDDNGKVKNLMINEHEAGWSRNMKQSIASMLQLDLSSMHLETPMLGQAFLTKENTVYGECVVSYVIHRTLGLEEKYFTVTKNMEPMSCTKFDHYTFNSKESSGCMIEPEQEMTTASRRIFNIENNGEDLLIKRLVAHGVINYFPWNAQSEAHYILANQTMELVSTEPIDSITLPEFNITEMVTLDDITFKKSESLYAVHAGLDPTYGRHVIDLKLLITKLIGMLGEAVDYMNENNLEMVSPEMKHGQTMNRILLAMSRMDVPSLEHVFNNIMEGITLRDITMKNLFLNMIPYVGTNATCLFTRNIIRKHKIEDNMAVMMLVKLPYNVRVPTDALLLEMEAIIQLGNDTSLEVRKAAILSFANLIHKTHKHESYHHIMESELVGRYVKYYFDRVMNEPTYEMKLVYLSALRNIDMHDAHKLVEPIVRGDLKLSEKPDYLRFHAMLLNWRRARSVEYIHNIYWPILTNPEAPLLLRLASHAILLEQPPRMDRLISLYWFMVYEKNDHLYNFHYTALVSLANAKDACLRPMMEMARKLLRFTRIRPASGIMSGIWRVDYENKKFGFGDSLALLMAADEHTGTPYALTFVRSSTSRRKPVDDITIWLRVEGVENVDVILRNITLEKPDIAMAEIENVLKRAGEDMPRKKPIHIEYALMVQGRTVITNYFDKIPDISQIMAMSQMSMDMKFNWQSMEFDELFAMQVPNDLGLPSLLYNNVPRVMSIQATNEVTSQSSTLLSMKFETMFRDWRHGFHSMEVYNPIADSWHAVRRVSAYDASLPIAMSVSYNLETKSVKLNFPRLPITPYSVSGIRSYVKNYVMVMEAEDGVLERYCGTNCHPSVVVTRGLQHRKNTTFVNLDSKDLGLRFSMYQYDCERATMPRSRLETLAETLSINDKSTWDNNAILGAMTLREYYLHLLISPEAGTCGYLARMEPSTVYPTSEVDINLRMTLEVPVSKIMSLLPATKFNLRGTLDAKAAGTNISAQSWSINANLGTSQGFVNDQLQIQMTRSTPGQTDLQICIDGYKIYPAPEADPLSRDSTTKQEVMGKLSITMGENENGTCVRDNVSVMINMKAEMSSEQKEELNREKAEGSCKKDIENPNYLYSESSIVPRTVGCLREALLRTYLRKYTYTVIYKNIPEDIMPHILRFVDDIRSEILSEATYYPGHTEQGIIKIFTEYPLNNEGLNLVIRTPDHEERYNDIIHPIFGEYPLMVSNTGMHYVVRDQLTTRVAGIDFGVVPFGLENTVFPRYFLEGVHNNRRKFCSVYPEILLNADGAVVPFTVPGQYTLLTGDHIGHAFSVFVKRLEPKKLGLLMSIRNHTIEVTPSATIPTVNVDGDTIDYVNGVAITDVGTSDIVRTTWNQNRLMIQSPLFDLEWTGRSVTLYMKVSLQGKVTGLCGHLDGTHKERMAKVYTFGQL